MPEFSPHTLLVLLCGHPCNPALEETTFLLGFGITLPPLFLEDSLEFLSVNVALLNWDPFYSSWLLRLAE